MLAGAPGCGTNLDQVIYNALTATAQTGIDLFLTDLANEVVDAFDDEDTDDADQGDDGDMDTDGDADGDGDGDSNGMNGGGEPPDGAALYAANCSACHGADGASGFAPDITESTTDDLRAGLASATHGSLALSDAEIEAIAVFLGGAESPAGDAAAGESFYAASGCAACHCADATGGCLPSAPALIGIAAELLEANLVGADAHVGGKLDASAADLADLAAFLASLE